MKKLLNDFIKNEDGVTAIEYALIGVAMAGVLALVLGKSGAGNADGTGFIGAIQKAFKTITSSINGYMTPAK